MENSLYDQLGDEQIQLLVDRFYAHVLQDPRINHLFKTDIQEVKRKQFMFLSQFFGGPPKYIEEFGHPRMRMRHMPHAISEDAAIAWLENMKAAIDGLEISSNLKQELFSRFPKLAAHMVNQ